MSGERGTLGQPLTERERQVLAGMAAGRTNNQIGRHLFITEDSVKTFARRLFRKLGARDRAHAVALGYDQGALTAGAGGGGDRG